MLVIYYFGLKARGILKKQPTKGGAEKSLLFFCLLCVVLAYSELERQKIIVTKLGKPSYVQNDRLIINQIRTSLIDNLLDTFLDKIAPLNVDYDELLLLLLLKEKYHDQSK
ncbi:hypothetical protein [Bacillus sp. Hm123]|uniref:hypothetical protein n=1 Tax=Bacillus sp. Hm123 TaxID=3450745 RepID=UPI003F43F455